MGFKGDWNRVMRGLQKYLRMSAIGLMFSTSSLISGLASDSYAAAGNPGFKADDYRKALWMATRFYGGQRSGKGVNWMLADYAYPKGYVKDADGDYDLEGGWHDCGDFPMFGQTQFYSAYVLIRGYLAFPNGYDDLYNGLNYADYIAKGKWDYGDGSPNGIPDILEEVKYATDFFIKATRDANTFYFQKGTGGTDQYGEHAQWVTSGYYSEKFSANAGGENDKSRPVYKNPDDGSMPAFCAATLAAMSRAYRKFDPAYADKCLQHARYAYAYAKAHQGKTQGTVAGNFYSANTKTQDDFVTAATEMYMATKEDGFKNDATAAIGDVKWHFYIFCYNNNEDIALANMGEYFGAGDQLNKLAGNNEYIRSYAGKLTNEGITQVGNDWGRMRFPGNAAFIAAIYDKAKKSDEFDDFIFKQVDFILGKNTAKQSYLTGFCSGCSVDPKHPHHRNVYLAENPEGDIPIPVHNAQHGSLIGGNISSTATAADDKRLSYTTMEVCIDYQAGLVGALAYIMSKLAPVDTAKFNGTPIRVIKPGYAKVSKRLEVLRGAKSLGIFPVGDIPTSVDLLGRLHKRHGVEAMQALEAGQANAKPE